MTNASTQMWKNKLRPPVISSIPGGTGYVAPGVTKPTPTVTPPVTATSTNNVPSSFPGFPNRKVATTANPVITRSVPAPTSMTPPANEITSRDDNQIKDYVAWAELNPGTLSVEDQFKLRRGQQVLQERAYQQSTIDPYKQQITQEETLRKQRESELKQRDTQLADARRRELELTYGKRISGQQEAGEKTMSAAQGVLSFSGFGRSTYAAEKQAEIQQQVNENINALNAERDYAIAKYEAELSGATAEELSGYDQNIADLRNKSAQFSAQLAQQMNEYNMQTAASYEERINNVLQLAQSLETVELTPGQQSEAGAYASLLLDSEGNINDKMLADIPPQIKGLALRKAAELKSGMTPKKEAPETIKAEDGSVYAFNDQTGQFEKIIGGKPMQSDNAVNIKNADGSESIMQYNTQTGQYDIPVQPSGFTPNGTPVNNAIQTAIQKCETGAQCGKFVNDVLQGAGLPRLVKDSYQSKEMAISQIGIATSYDDLGSGSVFAYPVKGSNYGHIGIVTGVNNDGTINIMDFNYKGDQQRRERQNVNPSEIINMGGRISKPIIREDTVPEQDDSSLQNLFDEYNRNHKLPAKYVLEGLGMSSKEFIDASTQNQSENQLSQTQKDQVYKSYSDDVSTIRTDYNLQQKGFKQAKTSLAQGGKGSYAAVVSFLKGLDDSVVKEGEYKAFTNAGIPITGKVEKWISEGYSGDIPQSVKDNFGALIDELSKTSNDIYKQNLFEYASLIDADNPGLGVTVLDPKLRGEYKNYKPGTAPTSTNDDPLGILG